MATDVPSGVHRDVDYAVLGFDLAFIAVIALVPVGTQVAVSESTLQAVTHYSGVATPLSLVGHAFVHFSPIGLLWNGIGFLVVSLVAYGMATLIGERLWFLLSLLVVVGLVPLLTGLVDEVVFTNLYSTAVAIRGFSGIVAGVAGLVYVSVLALVRRFYDPVAVGAVGAAIIIWLLVMVSVIYSVATIPQATIAVLVAAGGILLAGGRRASWSVRDVRIDRLGIVVPGVIVVSATLSVATIGLFPATPSVTGSVVNVYSHSSGFGFGVLIAMWGHRYWTQVDWV